MRLSALRLHNVRRFAGRGVAVEEIGEGVNVLCAVNEHGKSTCFDALHALFFQAHTGTPAAVQSLRPYSGGSPLVEADIETADGRFRLAKRFYAGRRADVTDLATGRLVAQADEAEAFIAALVGGGAGGPAGLLWVRQGNTGTDRRAKAEEDGEKRAREGVLSSVRGEVEAMTGGRRMSAVLAACEEELYRLVTATLRPKAGGPFAAALEERDRLAERERLLGAEVTTLRAALDQRRRDAARLAEVEDPQEDTARRAALAASEAALAAAMSHGAALKTAEAEAALAHSRWTGARAALEAHREARNRLEALGQRGREAGAAREAAVGRKRAALSAGEAAAGAIEAAEREEREARELLARLEKAMRAREAAERAERTRETLAKAEAARREAEEGEAALRALDLPQTALREIEAAEARIAGLEAAEAARSPTLRIDYLEGAEGAVSIDAAPLARSTELRITAMAQLDIAGVGRLTIRPERSADADRLTAAKKARDALLQSLGVSSLAEARGRREAAEGRKGALALARQRLQILAPDGIAALQGEVARLEGEPGEALELKGDPQAARAALEAAERQVGAARNAAREQAPARESTERALLDAERALAAIEAETASLAKALGDDPERDARLATEEDAARSVLAEAEETANRLRAQAPDLANAEATLARTRSAVEAAASEAGTLREALADLNGRIRARADDAVEESWQEAAEALGETRRRVARFEHEVALLARLRDALHAARTEAREHYFEPVMAELRPLMGLLFDDAAVVFDDRTLLPQSFRRDGLEEPVEVLSGGMREQLAVLTRLAFARLLAREGRAAPVILDDALVYSDDDRIEKMFDALHRQARDQQIIVFSCRQRAFARLGGHRLALRDWEPSQR